MDFDFSTDLTSSYEISFDEFSRTVSGNRKLLNRFHITFLSKKRKYLLNGDQRIVDNYGGDANKFINNQQALSDPQGVSVGINIAIQETVESMKNDEPPGIPDTEKISEAKLTSLDNINDSVVAEIEVVPVEVENFADIKLNLPITKG